MPHRRFVRSLILLLAVAFAPRAAACALDVDVVGNYQFNGGNGRGYEVFDSRVYYQPLAFRVRAVSGSCSFYATVSPVSAAGSEGLLSGPGRQIRYQVYRDATGNVPLLPSPLATTSEVLTGTAAQGNAPTTFQVTYGIPVQQIVPAGVYTGQIEIAVYEGAIGSGILRARQQVPLSIRVPGVAEISFSSGAFDPDQSSYVLRFSTLHRNDMKGVSMRVRSNSGHRILLRSRNGGVMRRTDPSDPSTVPYTLYIQGRRVPLGQANAQAIVSTGETPVLGESHRFDFQIGDIADASAGDYEDVIDITVLSLR